jgi:uncharacterized membrane protein YjjP (DUF1212 family)
VSSLTPKEMEKIDRLVTEIKQKKLERENALELQQLLRHGQDEASKVGDNLLVIGLGLIMAGLIIYILDKGWRDLL